MCGIVGYVGAKNATDIVLEGLFNLEYRGYDSAGIALLHNKTLHVVKSAGRLQNLAGKLAKDQNARGACGIGHTRWATHGAPSNENAHPHGTQKLQLVHNGIIENYLQIKQELLHNGCAFESETDTEVAARLLDSLYASDPLNALTRLTRRLKGSYALGILFYDRPDTIYAVRKDSPLIIGLGTGENFIASDVPAILKHTRDYYLLEEGEIAEITPARVTVYGPDGGIVEKEKKTADWSVEQAQKGGHAHFMLKEMMEQPKALSDTVHPRIKGGLPDFSGDGLPEDFFTRYEKLHFVACGTAMHAGTVGKTLIEMLARVPVEVDLASEFRYRNPILPQRCLVVVISQSGETADTLAALRLAKSSGRDTLAIVNVAGSSIEREADYVLRTYAGPEIAVASTKAFSVQIALLYLLAISLAKANGKLSDEQAKAALEKLLDAIGKTAAALEKNGYLQSLAPRFTKTRSLFYLGRGIDHALAMEGSLKLKEISYIHSEAYAAGELKHGTISLIEEGVPVVALATQSALLPKMVSNIREVRARGAYVLLVTKEGFEIGADICDDCVRLPALDDEFMPILAVLVLQMFAYHVAVARGCDVDKPRNLAKSVTVE